MLYSNCIFPAFVNGSLEQQLHPFGLLHQKTDTFRILDWPLIQPFVQDLPWLILWLHGKIPFGYALSSNKQLLSPANLHGKVLVCRFHGAAGFLRPVTLRQIDECGAIILKQSMRQGNKSFFEFPNAW